MIRGEIDVDQKIRLRIEKEAKVKKTHKDIRSAGKRVIH